MFGTQYYLLFNVLRRELNRCESRTHKCDFVAMLLCHWLCSQDVIVGMYMVFLYILVFALYVQNRKSFCHCRTQLRRCKSFKPCWFVAYVKKNVFVLQASQRHDQDSWCRIFLTQLVTVALLVWHFSYMRHVCFSLFVLR